jgi:hypothetical protein
MKGYYNLSHLQAVARIPSLKTIEVKFSDLSLGLLTQINADPKLLALIEHRTRSKSTTSFLKSDVHELLTPKPDYFPMACASTEVQDKIWLRILKFTLEIPSKITVDLLQKPARNRGSLPLVSKRFQVSLMVQLFTGEYAKITLEAFNSPSLPQSRNPRRCRSNIICKPIGRQSVPRGTHTLPRFLVLVFQRSRHAEYFILDIWSR